MSADPWQDTGAHDNNQQKGTAMIRRLTHLSPDDLEARWFLERMAGHEVLLELGDPKRDILVVDGRPVAYSLKSQRPGRAA